MNNICRLIPVPARNFTAGLATLLLTCVGGCGSPSPEGAGAAAENGGAENNSAEFQPQTLSFLTAVTGSAPRIADEHGRTIIFRGINVVQIGDYFQNDNNQPPRFDLSRQDFADIAALGFNHVRLIVHWSLLEPQPGFRDIGYVETIRQAVNWARQHDLYIVLDMHQDAWGKFIATPESETCVAPNDSAVGWDGAPDWATLDDDLPTCKAQLRELSPAVAQAWQSFFLDRSAADGIGIQTHLVETWRWLVDELGADPVIAGYDPLNEPNSGFLFGQGQTQGIGEFYSRVIDVIRPEELRDGRPLPGAVFFEPGVEWSAIGITAVPAPTFTSDSAIVFSPHIYAESISANSIRQGWDNAVNVAATYQSTVWSGEWGYFDAPADNDDQLRRFAAEEDGRLLHSAFWDWRQACGDPHNFYQDRASQKALSPSLVRYACPDDVEQGIPFEFSRMLSRAYPRAVPGSLVSLSSDIDSGSLLVQGSTVEPGIADLWFPDRSTGAPLLSGGSELAFLRVPATNRAAGGWRVQLRVAGDYQIAGVLTAELIRPALQNSPQP